MLRNFPNPQNRRRRSSQQNSDKSTTGEPPAGPASSRPPADSASPQQLARKRHKRLDLEDPAPREKLAEYFPELRQSGRDSGDGGQSWTVRSTLRDDRRASVTITEGVDKRILIYDHGDGRKNQMEFVTEFLEPLGLTPADLYPGNGSGGNASRWTPYGHPSEPDVVDAETINAWTLQARRWRAVGPSFYWELGNALGGRISTEAMQDLSIGASKDIVSCRDRRLENGLPAGGGWTWPERDGDGQIVGVMVRGFDPDSEKQKWAATLRDRGNLSFQSRRGLILPESLIDLPESRMGGKLLLPEGMSDVLAALSVGWAAIGRPAAAAQRNIVGWSARYLRRTRWSDVIVLADRDPPREGKVDGEGVAGAKDMAATLCELLGRDILVACPAEGFKDLRAQLNADAIGNGLIPVKRYTIQGEHND